MLLVTSVFINQISTVSRTVTVQNDEWGDAMRDSKEFNYDDDTNVEKVVKKSGPLGLLPIMYLAATVVIILMVLLFWWR